MSEMRVAASTFPFLYSHNGLDAVLLLHEMGYRLFEMMIFPPHCWPAELPAEERRRWKAEFDARGLKITSFCYPLLDNNPNSTDRIMRRYTLDRYHEAVDLAGEWECPYVVMIPGPVNSLINPPEAWMLEWFVEGAQEVARHAKERGVGILIENVPFTFLPTAADMEHVCGMIGEGVGVNYDICNGAYIREDVGKAIHRLGKLVRNVHISDTGYGEFVHARLGTGIVDVAPAAKALQDIGYDGVTVLEIIADALQPGNEPEADIRASHEILARHGFAPLGAA